VSALTAPTAEVPRMAAGVALAGWIGAALALVLGSTRMVRGQRTAPGEPTPELGRMEAALLLLLVGLAVAALVVPAAWEAAPRWSARVLPPPSASGP
jgi:hypothetical protein